MAFVNIGCGSHLNMTEVLSIIPRKSKTVDKLVAMAKSEGRYMSISKQYPVKCIIICKNGYVYGSPISARTLSRRSNYAEYEQEVNLVTRINANKMDNDDEELDNFLLEESDE